MPDILADPLTPDLSNKGETLILRGLKRRAFVKKSQYDRSHRVRQV
jgi:hypothetical protein